MRKKRIKLTLTNQLKVSGCFIEASLIRHPACEHEAAVLDFRFAVSEYVRPYQLFAEREWRNDDYEDESINAGHDHMTRYAIEGAIPCMMCCDIEVARQVAKVNFLELITMSGQIGNPLVLCNEGGKDYYESKKILMPTTIFVTEIFIPRTNKVFIGHPLYIAEDKKSLMTIDKYGDQIDLSVPFGRTFCDITRHMSL